MDFGVGVISMKIELQDENDCIYAFLYDETDGETSPLDKVYRCKLFGLCLKKCEKYIRED